MGLFIKLLVYSNKEYAIVTISVNNLVTRLKFRTNEAKKSPNLPKDGYMNNSWRIYSTFPLILPFYQSFSISYIEIGVNKSLVMKLMPGCGKDKYLTEISWKLTIFAFKAFISCIFPKNITNFLEKHMYAPCF